MCDVVAIIISIIAIIVSIITFLKSQNQEKQLNTTNLNSNFYLKTFEEYLTIKIPECRESFRYINGYFSDEKNLTDVLTNMVKSALYFRWTSPEFYNDLSNKAVKLEEFIIEKEKRKITNIEYESIIKEVDVRIEEIYKTIFDAFLG